MTSLYLLLKKYLKIVVYNKEKEAILWKKKKKTQKEDHDIPGKQWR